MTTYTKPYNVIAMHRIDGQVLLGEFDSKQERDRFYEYEHAIFKDGGYDSDTKDICRGEVHGMVPRGEEPHMAEALMAQYEGHAGKQGRKR